MGDTPSIYSDYQYERLRLRLLAFQHKHSKKPQGLANDIVNRTGYAMTYDGGRKRVERFLNNANRVSDDFVAAVEAFLGDFQLIDYEAAALALSKLTRGPQGAPSEADIARFAGIYHCEMTGLVTAEHETSGAGNTEGKRIWVTTTLPDPAYPVFRMAPMHNHAGLYVWAANLMAKPEQGARPEDLQNVPSRGIASRFGADGLLIVIREPQCAFYYNVRIVSDAPFTLYGNGQHFSDGEAGESIRPFLPIDPHCEIRMTRVAGHLDG